MSNGKNAQQAKISRRRIYSIIAIILLSFIFLFFLSFSIRNIIICNHINAKDLKEYSGRYTIHESHRTRNFIYFISLENGDVLRITPELLKKGNDFTESATLHFIYSEPKFGLECAYMCVGIFSHNGAECYLEIEDSFNEATMGVYIGILISSLTIALVVIVFFSFLIVNFSKKR